MYLFYVIIILFTFHNHITYVCCSSDLFYIDVNNYNIKIDVKNTKKNKVILSDHTKNIALLIPTTTINTNIKNLHELPFLKIFLPSFINTTSTIIYNNNNSTGNGNKFHFKYQFFFGYDEGDQFLDNKEILENITQFIQNKTTSMNILTRPTKHIKIINLRGHTSTIWNILAKKAYETGFSTFYYQINDDVQMITKDWNEAFINALENNKIKNFGVTGPFDINTKHCISQSFVSYLHLEIFGYYYPSVLTNWRSDPWISNIYGPNHTFWLKKYKVINTNFYGRRYQPNKNAFQIYEYILLKGCNKIKQWVSSFYPKYTSTIKCI